MYSLHKLLRRKVKSERGFVLIVAIMTVVIMVAIGFFALTMTSGDLIISSRLASERQAFSAAETGAHVVYAAIDLKNFANADVNDIQINPEYPNLIYSASTTPTNQRVTVAGFDPSSMAQIFQTVVTGENTRDGSSVSIAIGLVPPPTPGDTQQGKL